MYIRTYVYRQFSNIDKSKTSFARLTFLSLGARFVCIRFWLTWLMDDDDDNNDIDGENVAQVSLWYTHPDQTKPLYPQPHTTPYHSIHPYAVHSAITERTVVQAFVDWVTLHNDTPHTTSYVWAYLLVLFSKKLRILVHHNLIFI